MNGSFVASTSPGCRFSRPTAATAPCSCSGIVVTWIGKPLGSCAMMSPSPFIRQQERSPLLLPELGIGGAHGHDLHVPRDGDQRTVD